MQENDERKVSLDKSMETQGFQIFDEPENPSPQFQQPMPQTYNNEYSPETYKSAYERCPHCGDILPENNANFCQSCGKRIFKGAYQQSLNSQSPNYNPYDSSTQTQSSFDTYGSPAQHQGSYNSYASPTQNQNVYGQPQENYKVPYDSNSRYKYNRTDYSGVNPPVVSSSLEKDKVTALILCALGLIGIGGLHKFYEGKIGLGILYFLTGGLFYIGTIVDLIRIATKPNDKYIP